MTLSPGCRSPAPWRAYMGIEWTCARYCIQLHFFSCRLFGDKISTPAPDSPKTSLPCQFTTRSLSMPTSRSRPERSWLRCSGRRQVCHLKSARNFLKCRVVAGGRVCSCYYCIKQKKEPLLLGGLSPSSYRGPVSPSGRSLWVYSLKINNWGINGGILRTLGLPNFLFC